MGNDDFVIGWRNYVWAKRAYAKRRAQFECHKYEDAFCEGFIDGYCSVGDGGDGCTPPLPPNKYWGWKYQSGEGQGKVAAWYSGYPLGAQAAEEDGIGYYGEIQISSSIQAAYDGQKTNNGCLTCPPYTNEEVIGPAPEIYEAPLVPDVTVELDDQALFKPKTVPSQRSLPAVSQTNQIERLPTVERSPYRTVSYDSVAK